MQDSIYFIGLILLAGILLFYGFSFWGGGFSPAEPADLFASVFAAVETDWSSPVGQFLITFDNFKNLHQEILDKSSKVKIFDVSGYKNIMWIGTDHGLFLSRDGGLTWNNFTSSNKEINSGSLVFKILPASFNGEDYFVSVFSNGKGVIYRTWDYFFNLEKLIDFDQEAAYDIYRSGDNLYLAMSTGQIIRYNLTTKQARVANVFKSPIIKIYYPGDGYIYVLLKNGVLAKAETFESEFKSIAIPGSWLFGSTPVKNVWFDASGMYILTNKGVYASYDGGKSFSLLKRIPLTKNQIDALGVNKGLIYIVSEHKLYVSSDRGGNWQIIPLANQFKVSQFYFVGPKALLSL